jgi:hypothetical protein
LVRRTAFQPDEQQDRGAKRGKFHFQTVPSFFAGCPDGRRKSSTASAHSAARVCSNRCGPSISRNAAPRTIRPTAQTAGLARFTNSANSFPVPSRPGMSMRILRIPARWRLWRLWRTTIVSQTKCSQRHCSIGAVQLPCRVAAVHQQCWIHGALGVFQASNAEVGRRKLRRVIRGARRQSQAHHQGRNELHDTSPSVRQSGIRGKLNSTIMGAEATEAIVEAAVCCAL